MKFNLLSPVLAATLLSAPAFANEVNTVLQRLKLTAGAEPTGIDSGVVYSENLSNVLTQASNASLGVQVLGVDNELGTVEFKLRKDYVAPVLSRIPRNSLIKDAQP